MLSSTLAWFVVIGIALFAVEALRQDDGSIIVVDAAVKARIAALWQTQMGREANEQELASLVDNWLQEEMLFREAQRLGLDQDDTIVRRRLVQKMGFLVQDVEQAAITEENIQGFYQQNQSRYQLPSRYSLIQLLLGHVDAQEEIKAKLEAGEDFRELSQTSMLPKQLHLKSKREIAANFGQSFAAAVPSLAQGQWSEPVKSSFGWHLVRVDEIRPASVAPFAQVYSDVKADLEAQRSEEKLQTFYESLKAQYPVVYD